MSTITYLLTLAAYGIVAWVGLLVLAIKVDQRFPRWGVAILIAVIMVAAVLVPR